MRPTAQRAALSLGIDLGTSGCRAVVIDDAGTVVAQSRVALPASRQPLPGASEQLPGDWWDALSAALDGITGVDRRHIAALSVDGTSSSLLLCDPAGEPLGPAMMYDDTRASAQAQRVAATAPTDSPARGPGSALSKLLFLLDNTAPPRDARALHQADWIAGRLCGRFGHSDENNALKLGYDVVARHWPAWLGAFRLPPGLLPEVHPVGQVLGRITPTIAARFGLCADALVVAGTTDSNAATLAAGISQTAEAVTSLGSTLVLKVLSERPVADARYGVYSHRIGDLWLAGGASNSGGAVLRKFFTADELAELSRHIDPDTPSGLDYYPLPATGERFPVNDPQMPARLTPRPADPVRFLHGMLEGMAAIEARGYRRLAELGAPYPERVLSSGGGAVNTTWAAIRARHLGVTVEAAAHSEAAYGAAGLARAALCGSAANAPEQ